MSEIRQSVSRVIRFGSFDADLQTQELRKHGVRLRLPGQSFQILKMLLEHPGNLVTRDELQKALWPSDTFVDFEHGLSAAVNRLREALGDSAEEPCFVETLPRRGYRFIGTITPPVATPGLAEAISVQSSPSPAESDRMASSQWTFSRIAAVFLAGLIGLALVAFAPQRWRYATKFAALTEAPFTALPGQAGHPAFSPDGSRIAFEWTGDIGAGSRSVDLYLKAIGSEDLIRLTKHPSNWISPAWSPDGSQIAFHRLSKDESGIYIVSALEGPERKLRSTHAAYGVSMSISWSPDGKSIAFADSPVAGGHRRLNFLSLETLESSQMEHDDRCQEEGMPVFSHNGKSLAYACFPPSGGFALALATSAGTSPRLIKSFSGELSSFAWTSDDKHLIFSGAQNEHARNALRELSITDASLRELPFGVGAGQIDVSAKAERLIYDIGSGGNNNLWRGDLLHPQNPPVKLIFTSRDQGCPQYSPDGKYIAFCSNRGGPGEIWMSNADGTNVVQLSNLKNPITGMPSWSPDGKKIVFDSRTAIHEGGVHADLYLVDIAERVPRKLSTGSGEASMPSWSRDGKWIYFIGGGNDFAGERIYRVAPEGGRAQVLTTARGFGPKESFDGQSMYFAIRSGSTMTLWTASLNPTGTEFPVEGMPPLSHFINWTLTRDGVFFFAADAYRTLNYYSLSTKQVRAVLTIQGGSFLGLSVSPDGRYILFPQFDDAQRDIMLVDHFR